MLRYGLLAAIALLALYVGVFSSDRSYAKILEWMPEETRSWYSSRVLGGRGAIMSAESEKIALLNVFVKNRGLFPKGSYGELYKIAVRFQGDPIGIMALQIAFDSGDRDLICDLFSAQGFRESFVGKLEAYRESNSPEDVKKLEEIISLCNESNAQ